MRSAGQSNKPFKLTAPKRPPKYEKEWAEQRLLFDYAKAHEAIDPRWKLLNASMNGLRSTPAAIMMAKLCGLKPGYPDTFLPVQGYAGCPGMFVEGKRKHPKWETCGWNCATDDQRWWRDRLREQGFQVEIAHGYEQWIAYYEAYLKGDG